MSILSGMVAPTLCVAGLTNIPLVPGFAWKGKVSMQTAGIHGDIQPGH